MSRPISHRLFFALDPDARVRSEVAAFQNHLDERGRAVPAANFHVTLAFLGMQEPEVIPRVREVASRLEFEPCQVILDRLGHFPRAGVVWLGASRVPDTLRAFQHSLVGALLDEGIGYDRKPWELHLTLYRKLRKPPPIMQPVHIEWAMKGFDLFESVSVKRGVEYHSIGHWQGRGKVRN